MQKPRGKRTAKRKPNVVVTGNALECCASIIEIMAKQDRRISRLEKKDARNLIGFGANCEASSEIPEPSDDDLWESGVIG